MQLYNNEYYQRRTPHYCSKTKCTLINTRTQATLALGARWNGWGAFLSSSERNTLGEGVFPVIHSRNALLLLTKAQPFQRPRQQPQQLQLATAATSSSCHNKATNPPQQHEHTCCCKNFGSMEIGSGMGWCTHGVTGQAVPYATAYAAILRGPANVSPPPAPLERRLALAQ